MMTSVSGRNVVAAPCCQTLYTTPAYSSINLSASEFWTDGQRVHGLYPNDGGLRSCACGSYFLLKDAEKVDFIQESKPFAPDGWENIKSTWWTRFRGRQTKEQVMAFYDTRPLEVIKAEAKARVIPPPTQFVKDQELAQVIHDCLGERDILIVARRRYWRYLNDPYREIYREHRDKDQSSFPLFEPTELQISNMLALLDLLLQTTETCDPFEVIELFRELGKFTEAKSRLDQVEDQKNVLFKIMSELIEEKTIGPARFRY